MSGGNRGRRASSSSNSHGMERIQSSQTIRLGGYQPQAPGHRTIHCNNRELNAIVRFKVPCFCDLYGVLFNFFRLSDFETFGCGEMEGVKRI